jgi:two-component system CheB/CheR fusion protein
MITHKNYPKITCDRIKISELFYNLINNAIKFSSQKDTEQPIIEIGYIEKENAHQFTVKDNGIGIDPKYHNQIFGIFKRLNSTKKYEGSGIGLNIVKGVIEDHQGKIWIESEVGQGTTFIFTIPKDLKHNAKT